MKTALVTILVAILSGCAPRSYGVTFDTSSAEDPRVVASELATVLAEWDARIGVRSPHPIRVVGNGTSMLSTSDLGECLKIGEDRFISVNLDLVRSYSDPKRVFRHVLFHELYHAEATCTDKDHTSDPRDLMYPTVLEENLDALPTKAQRAAIGAR